MTHHCHDQTCSHEHHHSGSCPCCCHHHEHEHGHFSDELLALADEAWMELLKEKIKQKIQETTGQHLDHLAALVSTANHNRWNNKLGINKTKEEFQAKVDEFFNK